MRPEVLVRSDLTARLSHQNQKTQRQVQIRLKSSPQPTLFFFFFFPSFFDVYWLSTKKTVVPELRISSTSKAAARLLHILHWPASPSISAQQKKKRNCRIWDPSSKRAGNFWCPFPWLLFLLLLLLLLLRLSALQLLAANRRRVATHRLSAATSGICGPERHQ